MKKKKNFQESPVSEVEDGGVSWRDTASFTTEIAKFIGLAGSYSRERERERERGGRHTTTHSYSGNGGMRACMLLSLHSDLKVSILADGQAANENLTVDCKDWKREGGRDRERDRVKASH